MKAPSRMPVAKAPEAELGYDPSKPSKSQRKRDMTALQDLGEELVALAPERLAQLDLSETLADAILEAQRIRSHEGKRRQLQYIGKLMRSVEAGPLRAQLAQWQDGSRAAAAALHRIEHWRDKLLEDDAALNDLGAQAGPLEPALVAALRENIRMARIERAAQKPPRHSRALFQLLREILKTPAANGGTSPSVSA